MKNTVDPDQLASSEASGSTLCSKGVLNFEKSSVHGAFIRSNTQELITIFLSKSRHVSVSL